MVLDIRDLRESVPPPTPMPASAPANPHRSLEQLLKLAAGATSPTEQARAVEQLRQLIPGVDGVDYLFAVLARVGAPARLAAAQTLGFHRQWLSSRSRIRQVVQAARQAETEGMAVILVWALRQRNEAAEFLLDERPGVAVEAALGVPLNRQTLPLCVEALERAGRPFTQTETGRVLVAKLPGMHPALVQALIELLIERSLVAGAAGLLPLLEWVPQVPLFEAFVVAGDGPDFSGQTDGALRARAWQQLARAARHLLERAPSSELLRHLLTRSGEDDGFVRRHDAFLRAAMRQADRRSGPELISHVEHLTFKASEEMVARLAQVLVELAGRLDGPAAAQASALLESWKGRSAELKLRIYQLQHKLGTQG